MEDVTFLQRTIGGAEECEPDHRNSKGGELCNINIMESRQLVAITPSD